MNKQEIVSKKYSCIICGKKRYGYSSYCYEHTIQRFARMALLLIVSSTILLGLAIFIHVAFIIPTLITIGSFTLIFPWYLKDTTGDSVV